MIRVLLIGLSMFISQEHSHYLFMPISCGLLNGVVGAGADVAGGGVELAKLGERIEMMIGKVARSGDCDYREGCGGQK